MNAEVIEKTVNEISEYKPFEKQLTDFKKKYEGMVYDLDDESQNKQARSDRLEIGKAISKLDKAHDVVKAPHKDKIDLIDGERKRIKDDLIGVQDGIKSQIQKHEKAIADKAEELQDKVEAIENHVNVWSQSGRPNSKEIQEAIEKLNAHDVDDSYEHRKADATLAKVESLEKLETMLTEATAKEENDRELKRLQDEEAARLQDSREEAIRKEAAENATREAELAAQKKIDDAEADKQKAIDDAANAKIESERLAKEAEENSQKQAKLAASQERERIENEQAEAKRIQDEADKKEAAKKDKQAYRAKIHKAAKDSFIATGMDEKEAIIVVNMIIDERIDNVRMVY